MWELLAELNDRPMRHLGQSRRELFESLDKPALAPLPAQPYEFARWKKARVHIDYHVSFEKHYYSVPYTLIGKEVDIRVTEKTVEIYYQRKRRASHRLEAACRRALPAGIRSYKGVRNILENKLDQLAVDQAPAAPLPSHANIRGETYYN